ncbi:hypothetical protein HK405_003481 [Cladochytrium tenue]|nr:hypothetical protein HK405_003481 [Cladochytrium tenue]
MADNDSLSRSNLVGGEATVGADDASTNSDFNGGFGVTNANSFSEDAWRRYIKQTGTPPAMEEKLRAIFSPGDLTLVALVDDSDGMDARLRTRTNLPSITDGLTTRWSELALHLEKLLRLADAAGIIRGVDLLFMNTRKRDTTVTEPGDVRELFFGAPDGSRSPLNALLKDALARYGAAPGRVLLLVFCNAEPTDGGFMKLHKQLSGLPPNCYVSLVNCSENVRDITPLYAWERDFPRYHGQSTYYEELVTVHAAEGTNAGYNRSVYVQDMIIGPFFPEVATQVRASAGKIVRSRLVKAKGPIYEAQSYGRADAESGKAFGQVVSAGVDK